MSKPTYLVDQRFGQVIHDRLARKKIKFSTFCEHLDISEKEVTDALNGNNSVGSVVLFSVLDRYFGTTEGYFKRVYDNCFRILMAEVNGEPDEKTPPDKVVISVDLLRRLSDAALDYHWKNPAGKEGWAILTELGVKSEDDE